MCYRTRKYTVCRRVRASFNDPEIVQAGAVKGLMLTRKTVKTCSERCSGAIDRFRVMITGSASHVHNISDVQYI